jgi:hypothetical protein
MYYQVDLSGHSLITKQSKFNQYLQKAKANSGNLKCSCLDDIDALDFILYHKNRLRKERF